MVGYILLLAGSVTLLRSSFTGYGPNFSCISQDIEDIPALNMLICVVHYLSSALSHSCTLYLALVSPSASLLSSFLSSFFFLVFAAIMKPTHLTDKVYSTSGSRAQVGGQNGKDWETLIHTVLRYKYKVTFSFIYFCSSICYDENNMNTYSYYNEIHEHNLY